MPSAVSIPVERKLAGLSLIVPFIQAAYPGQRIDLANVGSLIDKVADAVERNAMQEVVVYGTRLLSVAEVGQLVGVLSDGSERS